jgi:hypothetical protein
VTLADFFTRVGDMLIGREHGPLHFRFVMQPLVAVVLAFRVGLRDAREGRPPYFFWAVFTDKARRPELLRLAWKDVGKVFCAALALDMVYELIVWHWIYPTQAILVAVVLAIIPYLLVRGPATRIARHYMRKKDAARPTKPESPPPVESASDTAGKHSS